MFRCFTLLGLLLVTSFSIVSAETRQTRINLPLTGCCGGEFPACRGATSKARLPISTKSSRGIRNRLTPTTGAASHSITRRDSTTPSQVITRPSRSIPATPKPMPIGATPTSSFKTTPQRLPTTVRTSNCRPAIPSLLTVEVSGMKRKVV